MPITRSRVVMRGHERHSVLQTVNYAGGAHGSIMQGPFSQCAQTTAVRRALTPRFTDAPAHVVEVHGGVVAQAALVGAAAVVVLHAVRVVCLNLTAARPARHKLCHVYVLMCGRACILSQVKCASA